MMIQTAKTHSPSRLPKMMFICIGTTLIALFILLLATLMPGSPTGGPDGPYILAFLVLIGFLYVILPLHVIGFIATGIKCFRAADKVRFVYPLSYFLVWFSALFLYWVLSGAAEPTLKEISRHKFGGQHAAEMALVENLMHRHNRAAVPDLIRQVNDINLPDPEFGMTALQWAAKDSSAAIVKLLLDAGADAAIKHLGNWTINQATLINATALDFAAWSEIERKEKIELLLESGVKPTAQALVGPCDGGEIAIVEQFLAGGINLQTAAEGDGLACFHVAARAGNVGLIETLYSLGVLPSTVTKYKLTPLDFAMLNNQHRAAIALLKKWCGSQPAEQVSYVAYRNLQRRF